MERQHDALESRCKLHDPTAVKAEITFSTHHEVLTLIYVLQSDASASTKQRALQVLEPLPGLRGDAAVHDLLGGGVDADLAD